MRWVAVLFVTLMFGGLTPGMQSFAHLSALGATERQTPGQEASGEKQSPVPRANPDASGKYHIGDGVASPKVIFAPDPEFTDKARRKKLGGTCVLSVLVDTDGKPHDVKIVQSIASGVNKKLQSTAIGLDQNAVKAVQQYRFEPATYQGKPVPIEVTIEVAFRIY